jgi:predicted dehydrogenase
MKDLQAEYPGIVGHCQSARKVLIAGFGSVGRRHFRNLESLGVTDISFYRSGQSTLCTDEIQTRPVFKDVEAALNCRPSAVIVANPTSLHMPVALAAARVGADLFIEKPLTDSLVGCNELIRLCRDRGLVSMVGCQFRFHPLLRRLRERLFEGDFGGVLSVRAEYGDSLLRWHPWEDHRRGYSARAQLGGGAILTLIHPLDYLYWLFGPVRDVHASVNKAAVLETDVNDDIADVTLEFESGATGHIHLDFLQDPAAHTLSMMTDRGRLALDFTAGTLEWRPYGGSSTVEQVPAGYERNAMFVDELRHFLERVEDRKSSDVPLADGIAVLEIALKAKADAERRKQ